MALDAKLNSQVYVTDGFSFEPFLAILASKFATQNLMLNLNTLKKLQESSLKKVIGQKLLLIVNSRAE